MFFEFRRKKLPIVFNRDPSSKMRDVQFHKKSIWLPILITDAGMNISLSEISQIAPSSIYNKVFGKRNEVIE